MNQEQADHIPQGEQLDEVRLIRRLQLMMNLVMQVIAEDPRLTVDEASQMVADSRRAALTMFPGKELAYDLLYRPRFQRLNEGALPVVALPRVASYFSSWVRRKVMVPQKRRERICTGRWAASSVNQIQILPRPLSGPASE